MPLEPKKSRLVLFFVIGFGLALLLAGLKALFTWLTYTYAYSVPWIGGFLKSIEITEISNLLVFAILGAGIGGATLLMPNRWNHRIKLAFLGLLSPFVFSASYMMQQHLWVQQVASSSNISYREAEGITNDYLKRETGKSGFFGFFPFSTQLTDLPTRLEVLRSEQSVNPSDLLSQELSSYDDPRADIAAYVFERVGWLIRFMYIAIAALTAVVYYFKGALWAASRRADSRRADSRRADSRRADSRRADSRRTDSKKTVAGVPSSPAVTQPPARRPPIGKPSSAAPISTSIKPNKAPKIPDAPLDPGKQGRKRKPVSDLPSDDLMSGPPR